MNFARARLSRLVRRVAVAALSFSLLPLPVSAARDNVAVHAYVNDSCIVADEPFFIPASTLGGSDPSTAKFLPLLGIVIGKLAELLINHEIEASANRLKSGAARKDTRYAVSREMNLYRVDFQPAPAVSINAKLGCMTIVAAEFKPEGADCAADYVPKELARDSMQLPQTEWKTSRSDASIENELRRANVCVIGKAHAVYEARFEFSTDGTAYRLKDAGYQVESLLTTDSRSASRSVLYTLKISNPGATDQQETLSSAWVKVGMVTAGTRRSGVAGDAAPWLRVPPMSVEARRNFELKTLTHQDVMAEIDALKRAQIRNQRILVGLDQRIAAAGADVVEGLRQERIRVAVLTQTQAAELDARLAEYQDLPRSPLEFMPVTIEVGLTETESEKKTQLALADIIGKNSGAVAAAVGSVASDLISKSVAVSDLQIDPDPADATGNLGRARDSYFDALIAARAQPAGGDTSPAKRNLALERAKYNDVRRGMGLEPIK